VDSGLHLTDVTNASRTGLMNIHTQTWDIQLATFYGVPLNIMPRILASGDMFGMLEMTSLVGVNITGCMGDQQAALVGHCCTSPGMSKVTMGTGCFLLTNVGVRPIMSDSGLISTVAFKLAGGPTFFGLEGSVGCGGQALDWLNVGLGMAREEVVDLQEEEDGCGGVVIVPAYGGLLCPRWRPDAGGVILGLGLHTRPRHLVRATMEGVGHMLREVWDCMNTDLVRSDMDIPEQLFVSGGLASSDNICQVVATMLDIKLVRPTMLETTALGVAMVSGHTSGVWMLTGMASTVDSFLPSLNTMTRLEKIDQWEQAVQTSLAWGEQKEASKERTISLESSLPGTVWLFSTAAIVLLSMAAQ
jgi:glycerol kinase